MNARTRSGSIQLEDVKDLILGFEKRLDDKLSDVLRKVEVIEKSLQSVITNQVRIDTEVNKMKDVILNQQYFIEKVEAEKRANNVIVHGIPEGDIPVNNDLRIGSDIDKVSHLSKALTPNDNRIAGDIEHVRRIGKRIDGKNRPLLVRFWERSSRNEFLYEQKKFRQSDEINSTFGKVFVNKDSTFLVRKEEFRLRGKLKSIRSTLKANESAYIKNGKLFMNNEEIDCIDISKQLF